MPARFSLPVVLVLALALAAPADARFREITPPGGLEAGERITAAAVNRSSQVLVNVDKANSPRRAYVWTDGSYVQLNGAGAVANDINDSGVIAGELGVNGAAVLWPGPTAPYRNLGSLVVNAPYSEGAANMVDPAGNVAGFTSRDGQDGSGLYYPVDTAATWPGGQPPPQQVNPERMEAYARTASGVLLVVNYDSAAHVIYPNGTLDTTVKCIRPNQHSMGEQGLVVGRAEIGGPNGPLMWRDGSCTQLPLPPGVASGEAMATNDVGMIGGHGAQGAMFWPNTGSVELLNQTRNPGDGWTLDRVIDVGNDGEILGTGHKGSEPENSRIWLIDQEDNALDLNLQPNTVGQNDVFDLKATLRNTRDGGPTIGDIKVEELQRDDTTLGVAPVGLEYIFGPAGPYPAQLPGGQASDHFFAFAVTAPGSTILQTRVTGTDAQGGRHSDTAAVRIDAEHRVPTAQDIDAMYAALLFQIAEAVQRKQLELATKLAKQVRNKMKGDKAARKLLRNALADAAAAQRFGLPDDGMAWLPKNNPGAVLVSYLDGVEEGAMKVGKKAFKDNVLKNYAFYRDYLFEPTPGYRAAIDMQVASIAREEGKAAGVAIREADKLLADPAFRTAMWTEMPKIAAEAQAQIKAMDVALSKKAIEWDELMKRDPRKGAKQLGLLTGTVQGQLAVNTLETVSGNKAATMLSTFGRARASAGVKNQVTDESPSTERLSQPRTKPAAPLAGTPQLGNLSQQQIDRFQSITRRLNDKFGVNVELRARPINEYAAKVRNGVGKIEVIPTKNLTPEDLMLGAPGEYIAQAVYYRPKLPKNFNQLPRPLQEKLKLRAAEKSKEFDQFIGKAPDPTGKSAKVQKALKKGGGEFTIGRDGKALVELEKKVHPSGAILISYKRLRINGRDVFDPKKGGRPIISDIDFDALVDATTGRHLPAGIRGQVELELMRELRLAAEDGVFPFGYHGWTHSGFDVTKADFRHILKYQLMYMKREDALKLAEKYAKIYGTTAEEFLAGFNTGKHLVRITAANATFGTSPIR